MYRIYGWLALGYFVAATTLLMLLAILLLLSAAWRAITTLATTGRVEILLDSVGLMIIGFAVVETAKFFFEEEILRKRELRSALESRSSLTKFITIIVIAASLEALVMVFRTSQEDISLTIYPAALFAAATLALVGLGAYQWLSSRIVPASENELREAEAARARTESGRREAPETERQPPSSRP